MGVDEPGGDDVPRTAQLGRARPARPQRVELADGDDGAFGDRDGTLPVTPPGGVHREHVTDHEQFDALWHHRHVGHVGHGR